MQKKRVAAICGVAAAVLLIGGAFAYFSGQAETKANNFSIVAGGDEENGPIRIEEPNWDPSKAVDIEPGQLIGKDPKVVSQAEYDGWVTVRVSVPTIEAQKNDDTEYKVYDIFDLVDVDSSFTLLNSEVSDTAGKDSVYYYGYNNILESEAETPSLFKKLQMQDFTMVKEALADSVDVDAIIIQKINPETGVNFTSVAEAFSTVTNGTNTFEAPSANSSEIVVETTEIYETVTDELNS